MTNAGMHFKSQTAACGHTGGCGCNAGAPCCLLSKEAAQPDALIASVAHGAGVVGTVAAATDDTWAGVLPVLPVVRYVSTSRHQFQVLKAVIGLIVVAVMHVFTTRKRPSEILLHDPAMFTHLTLRCPDRHITTGVDVSCPAFPLRMIRPAEKRTRLAGLTGTAAKLLPLSDRRISHPFLVSTSPAGNEVTNHE